MGHSHRQLIVLKQPAWGRYLRHLCLPLVLGSLMVLMVSEPFARMLHCQRVRQRNYEAAMSQLSITSSNHQDHSAMGYTMPVVTAVQPSNTTQLSAAMIGTNTFTVSVQTAAGEPLEVQLMRLTIEMLTIDMGVTTIGLIQRPRAKGAMLERGTY